MPLEPVRSAEPPIVSGSAAFTAPSARCDACLVASLGGSASRPALYSAIAASKPAGSAPLARRSNSARSGLASSRACHASRAALPLAPASRQAAAISFGMMKGAWDQPSASRAAATSSAPSGAPCEAAVPALVGAPSAMVVRQETSDGRGSASAASMARAMSSGSWPSQAVVCQPQASKRPAGSSDMASAVGPSMEMPLSS